MAEMLAGKVALVSGIGPGLGIEIARLYAREGADIVMGARRTEVMEPLAAEIEAMGRRTVWQSTDITDPAQCQALADAAVEELGRLDVCVNNAFNDGFPIVNVENADLDRWRNVIDVNFFGSLNMTRACIPALRDSGAGGSSSSTPCPSACDKRAGGPTAAPRRHWRTSPRSWPKSSAPTASG